VAAEKLAKKGGYDRGNDRRVMPLRRARKKPFFELVVVNADGRNALPRNGSYSSASSPLLGLDYAEFRTHFRRRKSGGRHS
jgi:hypothetical protein